MRLATPTMGSLASRTAKAAAYAIRSASYRRDLEGAIRQLPAIARYLNQQAAVVERAEAAGRPFAPGLRTRFEAMKREALDFDFHVQNAAARAQDDGHPITVRDGQVTLNAVPLVFVVIAAVAIPIVAAYIVSGGIQHYYAYRTNREAFELYAQHNRIDLIDAAIARENAGSSWSGAAASTATKLGTIAIVGALALYAFKRWRK